MRITTTILTASQSLPAARRWYSLPSSQWTSDKKPRQLSADFQQEGLKDYGAAVGLPDYYRVYRDPWITMTLSIQNWLADVLGLAWSGTPYSQMTPAKKSVFRDKWSMYVKHGICFNNLSAWDNGRCDYILGKNIGAEPVGWEVLLCGGNNIDVIDDKPVYLPERYLGVQGSYRHYKVRAANVNRLPLPSDFLKDKAVCHIPTTIKPSGVMGVFPQFDERAVYPLWAEADYVYIWDRLIK